MKRVYILKSENGLVKIGISKNVNKRIRNLENSSGYSITDFYSTKMISNSNEIENSLHKKFKANRKCGEWFDIEFEKTIIALEAEEHKFEYKEKEKINYEKIAKEFIDEEKSALDKKIFDDNIKECKELLNFDNISFHDFKEHYENQKEIGENEEFEGDYPNLCKGIFVKKEFEEYKQDILHTLI